MQAYKVSFLKQLGVSMRPDEVLQCLITVHIRVILKLLKITIYTFMYVSTRETVYHIDTQLIMQTLDTMSKLQIRIIWN